MTKDTLRKLAVVENQISQVIKKEIGADVEVTIRDGWVSFYSENLGIKDALMALLKQVQGIGNLLKCDYYEEDGELGEAFTLTYQM